MLTYLNLYFSMKLKGFVNYEATKKTNEYCNTYQNAPKYDAFNHT